MFMADLLFISMISYDVGVFSFKNELFFVGDISQWDVSGFFASAVVRAVSIPNYPYSLHRSPITTELLPCVGFHLIPRTIPRTLPYSWLLFLFSFPTNRRLGLFFFNVFDSRTLFLFGLTISFLMIRCC